MKMKEKIEVLTHALKRAEVVLSEEEGLTVSNQAGTYEVDHSSVLNTIVSALVVTRGKPY